MHLGVELVNYPHLYNFSHFTLYLRTYEKYQILFKFVLISKFPIPIMENTLFTRHLEKQKILFRSISGVATLTVAIILVSLELQLLITTQQLVSNTVL